MSEEIVNKVAQSALMTIDLEKFYPASEFVVFDLKPYLFMELILKEKEFRASLQNVDWSQYQDQYVTLTCSADAIIPMWAYMLVTTYLEPVARSIYYGDAETATGQYLLDQIRKLPVAEYEDKRIVIKGCGDKPVGEAAYIAITEKLRPVAKSLMYGEPCSTVPLYKKK